MGKERYEDAGGIARGGMASIRRVKDAELRRELAMKLLAKHLVDRPEELQRFVEEAQVTAQLDHPNVPPVHELGVAADGRRFFTMKLVEGKTLEQVLTHDSFDPDDQTLLFRALQVFLKVCQAVAFAHSRGVVHCDLKPANVMVGPFGQVYVMDWGITRLPVDRGVKVERPVTVERTSKRVEPKGRVLGTLGYMAPEQARAKHQEIDERTDVFALGAILYRIVVGRTIYPLVNDTEALTCAAYARVTPPEEARPGRNLPRRLLAMALQAMALKKEDRYQTVEALHDDVESYLRGDRRHPMHVVKAGEAIVREGEPGDTAFIITRGRCEVWKQVSGKRQVLRELGVGDIFGETAIFTQKRRTATVEALEETHVVEVSRQSLEDELSRTWVLPDVVKALAHRFQDLDARVSRLRDSAEGGEVERQVLRHFSFHGEPGADGERRAPWPPLAEALIASGVRKEEAVPTAQSLGGVRVDAAAGFVYLSDLSLEEVAEVPPPPPPEA